MMHAFWKGFTAAWFWEAVGGFTATMLVAGLFIAIVFGGVWYIIARVEKP